MQHHQPNHHNDAPLLLLSQPSCTYKHIIINQPTGKSIMDPPECSGHSHDHGEHGDDLGLSLRPQMDLPGVHCFNESIPDSGRAILKCHEDRLSETPCVISQMDDPELLLHIPFTESVTVRSISVRSGVGGGDGAPPREIALFVNRDDLDFDTARELEPEMKLELLPPHHFVEGTLDYPLRPAGRFQNISSFTIFFKSNYGGEDEVSTNITYVGLKGKGTKMRRGVVHTVYESKPMPEDHQVDADKYPAASESC